MNMGVWTPFNEQWFQKRLEGINRETERLMNAGQWRNALKQFRGDRLATVIEQASCQFVRTKVIT